MSMARRSSGGRFGLEMPEEPPPSSSTQVVWKKEYSPVVEEIPVKSPQPSAVQSVEAAKTGFRSWRRSSMSKRGSLATTPVSSTLATGASPSRQSLKEPPTSTRRAFFLENRADGKSSILQERRLERRASIAAYLPSPGVGVRDSPKGSPAASPRHSLMEIGRGQNGRKKASWAVQRDISPKKTPVRPRMASDVGVYHVISKQLEVYRVASLRQMALKAFIKSISAVDIFFAAKFPPISQQVLQQVLQAACQDAPLDVEFFRRLIVLGLQKVDLSQYNRGKNAHLIVLEGSGILELDLSHCSCITADCLNRLEFLPQLQRLNLGGTAVEQVSHVFHLPKSLTSLDLTNQVNLGDEDVTVLCSRNTSLSTLCLSGCIAVTDQALASICHLSALTDLDLSSCPHVSNGAMPHMRHLSDLRRLDVGDSGISSEGLAALSPLRMLASLNLSGVVTVQSAALHVGELTKLIRLTGLCLSKGATDKLALEMLPTLGSLTKLELNETQCTFEIFPVLHSCFPSLHTLDLSDTPLTGDASQLRDLVKLRELRVLRMESCRLTDDVVPHLRALWRLEELLIEGNELSTEALLFVKLLPKLRKLSMDANDKSLSTFDCYQLESLAISHSESDTKHPLSAVGLASIAQFEALKELKLDGIDFTAEVLTHLYKCERLQKLKLVRATIHDEDALTRYSVRCSVLVQQIKTTITTNKLIGSPSMLKISQWKASDATMTKDDFYHTVLVGQVGSPPPSASPRVRSVQRRHSTLSSFTPSQRKQVREQAEKGNARRWSTDKRRSSSVTKPKDKNSQLEDIISSAAVDDDDMESLEYPQEVSGRQRWEKRREVVEEWLQRKENEGITQGKKKKGKDRAKNQATEKYLVSKVDDEPMSSSSRPASPPLFVEDERVPTPPPPTMLLANIVGNVMSTSLTERLVDYTMTGENENEVVDLVKGEDQDDMDLIEIEELIESSGTAHVHIDAPSPALPVPPVVPRPKNLPRRSSLSLPKGKPTVDTDEIDRLAQELAAAEVASAFSESMLGSTADGVASAQTSPLAFSSRSSSAFEEDVRTDWVLAGSKHVQAMSTEYMPKPPAKAVSQPSMKKMPASLFSRSPKVERDFFLTTQRSKRSKGPEKYAPNSPPSYLFSCLEVSSVPASPVTSRISTSRPGKALLRTASGNFPRTWAPAPLQRGPHGRMFVGNSPQRASLPFAKALPALEQSWDAASIPIVDSFSLSEETPKNSELPPI